MACSAYLLPEPWDHEARGITHSGLGPPTSIINEGNAIQACSQTAFLRADSQSRFPRLR